MTLTLLPAALLACSGSIEQATDGGVHASADRPPEACGGKAFTSLTVTPANAQVPVGTIQQLTATATFSDGSTQNIATTATWSSSDRSIAIVDPAGRARGVTVGRVTITATATLGCNTRSATSTLEVARATLKTIQVTPASSSVCPGATRQLSATGIFTDATTQDLTAAVTWASSDPATATVDGTGLATAIAPGMTTIEATRGTIRGTARLAVDADSVTSVAVTPTTATLHLGAPVSFTATATYSCKMTADVTTMAAWTSSDPAVATVGAATGIATPVLTGVATLTAAFGGGIGTANVVVVTGLIKSIAVTPATTSISVGLTQQFKATATFTDGTAGDVTSLASWTSSSTTTATISTSGLATAIARGTSTITATVTLGTVGGLPISGTASLVVCVAVTLTSLVVAPATPSIASGTTQPFTATATFTDGSTMDVTSVATWTSSSPAIATVSAAGAATGVTPGATTITATFTSCGVTKSGTATLTVGP